MVPANTHWSTQDDQFNCMWLCNKYELWNMTCVALHSSGYWELRSVNSGYWECTNLHTQTVMLRGLDMSWVGQLSGEQRTNGV